MPSLDERASEYEVPFGTLKDVLSPVEALVMVAVDEPSAFCEKLADTACVESLPTEVAVYDEGVKSETAPPPLTLLAALFALSEDNASEYDVPCGTLNDAVSPVDAFVMVAVEEPSAFGVNVAARGVSAPFGVFAVAV